MRVVCWFSCGAASASASRLAIDKYGKDRVVVTYCDTMANEHGDNARFFRDVENWLGVEINRVRSDKYGTIEEVFDHRKYMVGIKGAPCTVELKKVPRFRFQDPDDIHVFGFTSEEGKRIDRFTKGNPEIRLDWILRDNNIGREDCYKMIMDAGIKIPTMYELGYRNNNCLGCVKATSPGYWNKIRRDFPDVFKKRAEQSRRIGARLARVGGERIFLDELDPSITTAQYPEENISCGPECGQIDFGFLREL